MKPLSPAAIKFFDEEAKRFMAEYGGEPQNPDNPRDVHDVTYSGVFHALIETCHVPEVAMTAVKDFLATLPPMEKPGDDFKGFEILVATHNALAELVNADRYMQNITATPADDLQLPKKQNPSPTDRQIQESARQHDDDFRFDENEITNSAFENANTEELDRAIAESAESAKLTPVQAFYEAISSLLKGVITKTKPHVNSMIKKNLIAAQQCTMIAHQMMQYGKGLPPPGGVRDYTQD
jgi:hypothetical protein